MPKKQKKRSPNGLRSRHFTADFYPQNGKKPIAFFCSNAVGYLTQNSLQSVKQMQGVPFQNVTGEEIDIQEISCMNGTKAPNNGVFHIWWYDTTLKTYVKGKYTKTAYADDGSDEGYGTQYKDKFYWTTDNTDAFILAPLGWKHDPDALPTITERGKTFKPGEGFFILATCANPLLTISGQVVNPGVNEEFANVTMTQSVKQMITNPFPVGDYDIQEISCKNGSKDPNNGVFHIWWYDTTLKGYVKGKYTKTAYADDGSDEGYGTQYKDKFYWTTDNTDAFILAPLGWKHDPDALPTITERGKTFKTGESFFMLATCATPIVRFKNPFYVAPAE